MRRRCHVAGLGMMFKVNSNSTHCEYGELPIPSSRVRHIRAAVAVHPLEIELWNHPICRIFLPGSSSYMEWRSLHDVWHWKCEPNLKYSAALSASLTVEHVDTTDLILVVSMTFLQAFPLYSLALSSGGPPKIDLYSVSETLPANVDNKPPNITYVLRFSSGKSVSCQCKNHGSKCQAMSSVVCFDAPWLVMHSQKKTYFLIKTKKNLPKTCFYVFIYFQFKENIYILILCSANLCYMYTGK